MENNLPTLDVRETPYKVSGCGKLTVRDVVVAIKENRFAAVNISFKEKNLKVVATGGDDDIPLIQVCSNDRDAFDDEGVDILFEEFSGWTIWAASPSTDSVQVALIRL
jgi:hypothetical protein